MGLQNQLSDVSSESILIIAVVLIGKSVSYLNSLFFTILHALRLFPQSFESDGPHFEGSIYVGSGLANVTLLCEQLYLNRACSYLKRSEDGMERFGSDCVVCLNRLCEGDHVRKLACRHVFHKDCFDGWLEQLNFSCPVCRAPQVTEERVGRTGRRVAGDLFSWLAVQ